MICNISPSIRQGMLDNIFAGEKENWDKAFGSTEGYWQYHGGTWEQKVSLRKNVNKNYAYTTD